MPWKLILALVIAVVVAVFIGFNLQNSCPLSFGFATLESVPVYLTAMFSFLAGMLATLPFVVTAGRRRKKAAKAKARALEEGTPKAEDEASGGDTAASDKKGEKPSGLFASMRGKRN